MIERVIENWLTNTDERGYQIPFCQLLALKGYEVVHVSPHGPDEQGKDIIAIAPDGVPCAFQLKAGDISLAKWRDIRGEVEELLDISIHHPSVDKGKDHRAYLVVSGDLKDPVRRQIDDINNDRRNKGKKTLETILKGQLLADLVEANERFLPKDVGNIKEFLNLYTYDGKAPVGRERLSVLLNSIAGTHDERRTAEAVRSASNAVLFGSYLLSPFRREKNWWSLADGWIIIASTVFAIGERWGIHDRIAPTITLCLSGIREALDRLEEEAIESTDLLVGTSFFDGHFIKYRATILAGYITGSRVARKICGEDDWANDKVTELLDRHWKELALYSEGAVPCFLNIFWYLQYAGKTDLAQRSLQQVINSVTLANRKKGLEIINPYYELETVVRHQIGLPGEQISETFFGNSYTLDSLITLAVRYQMREYLEKVWRHITHVNMSEFVPEDPWETFIYRAEHGKLLSRFQNQTESWAALVQAAAQSDDDKVPAGLKKHPEFLPLLLLTYPHRLRPGLARYIDEAIESAEKTENS